MYRRRVLRHRVAPASMSLVGAPWLLLQGSGPPCGPSGRAAFGPGIKPGGGGSSCSVAAARCAASPPASLPACATDGWRACAQTRLPSPQPPSPPLRRRQHRSLRRRRRRHTRRAVATVAASAVAAVAVAAVVAAGVVFVCMLSCVYEMHHVTSDDDNV